MLHKDAVLGDSHFPHTWLYANAAARTGATGFISTDVYKLALQLDTQALYILTATTPVWYPVGVSGGVVAESHTAAVWAATNPVLVEGAFGYETDTTKFKLGDGVTAWNSLSHWRYVPEHITVATTGGTTVLTTAQNKATSIQTTGVLVSNAIIVVANTMAPFVAENTNTGAFTTTFKTAAGTGVAIAQATHQMLYADSVNVEAASSAGAGSGDVVGPASAVNLSIAQYSGTTGKIIADSGVAVSALEVVANKATTFGTVNNTLYPTVQAVKNYVDPLVVGLWDDRGSYDASVNTFPAAGGSGTAGAVLKGDIWTVSVAGTLGGAVVKIGDTVRALADTPGQTASNWSILETNIGYVPANVAGNLGQFAATTSLQLANTISDETGSGALVFANTPTLVTPALGAATATSINGATITSGTLNGSVTGTNTGDNTVATALTGAPTIEVTAINLGHASDTTLTRSAAGVMAVESVVIPSVSSTNTLTNKRVTARTSTEASSATPTINTDNVDIHTITALAVAITSMTTNLTGTPVEGDSLIIEITGTAARAITWGASFEAATATLPSTTVGTEKLITGFLWNTTTSKWSCVANGVAPGTVYAALAGSASQAFSASNFTTAQGLVFPATQNPSANANTLDDYEEGTWTPAFTSAGSTFSYATQTGTYTKIGRMVYINYDLILNTSGNTLAGAAITITGLPFAAGVRRFALCDAWYAFTTALLGLPQYIAAASSTINLYKITAATTGSTSAVLVASDLHATSGSNVAGHLVYEV